MRNERNQQPLHMRAGVGFHGCGYFAANLIHAAHRLGFQLCYHPTQEVQCDPHYLAAIAGSAARGANCKDYMNGAGVALSVFDTIMAPFGSPALGWHLFELDGLKTQVETNLRKLDGIIVCSQWAARVLATHSFDENRVFVVPGGVDPELFAPRPSIGNDRYVFLNVGQWQTRKGQALLVDAFLDAFPKDADVVLRLLTNWLCPSPNPTYEELKRHVLDRADGRVEFLPYVRRYSDLPEIFSQADCGVFPYRGEGWCMPLIEMMACGKPVIATYHSGPTQYLTEDNAYLLHPCGYEYAFDVPHFVGEGRWATIDKGDLIDLLRHAYNRGRHVNHAGIATARVFTWENSVRTLMSVVEDFQK